MSFFLRCAPDFRGFAHRSPIILSFCGGVMNSMSARLHLGYNPFSQHAQENTKQGAESQTRKYRFNSTRKGVRHAYTSITESPLAGSSIAGTGVGGSRAPVLAFGVRVFQLRMATSLW